MKTVHRSGIYIMIGFLLLMMFPGVTLASDTTGTPIELTLDEAISKALVHSDTLKQADYDVDRSEEVRGRAEDKVVNMYTPAPGEGSYNATAAANYTSAVVSGMSYESAKLTKGIKTDTLKVSVFQYYTVVLGGKEKVAAAEKALANALWQQRVAQIGYSVGTVSESAKILAEANYAAKKAALESERASLEDKYQKLDDLVGLNVAERPVLKDDPPLVPLVVDDLEMEIQRRVTSSPNIEIAAKSVEQAKLALDLYVWNSGGDPYEAKEIDYYKAELSANNSETNMRVLMRTLYQGIVQMELQYVTLQQNYKSAEENLRIKQVQFDVGMATQGDVISAENELATIRQNMKTLVYQHELYVKYFEQPWTYSASS